MATIVTKVSSLTLKNSTYNVDDVWPIVDSADGVLKKVKPRTYLQLGDLSGTTVPSNSTYAAAIQSVYTFTPSGSISATNIHSAIVELDSEKMSNSLTSAYIFVGNGSNIATGVPVTGDITITNAGVTAIGAGVIVNADVNASAAILASKLGLLTGLTKTIGSIAATDTVLQAFGKTASLNGDAVSAAMQLGATTRNRVSIISDNDKIIDINPTQSYCSLISIGDNVATSDGFVGTIIGTTNESGSSSGTVATPGIGVKLQSKVAIGGTAGRIIALDIAPMDYYNPSAHVTTGFDLVGLRLPYVSGTGDYKLSFTRNTAWTSAGTGDATTSAFSVASLGLNTVGGNGSTTISYVLGDPAKFIRIVVEEVGSTTKVEYYLPAYTLAQIT